MSDEKTKAEAFFALISDLIDPTNVVLLKSHEVIELTDHPTESVTAVLRNGNEITLRYWPKKLNSGDKK